MNLQTINTDIQALEKALKLIEKTDSYLHFAKSKIMLDICEAINILKDKAEGQIKYLKTLK